MPAYALRQRPGARLPRAPWRRGSGRTIRGWTTEETTVASWTVPEGLMVERQVRATPPKPDRVFLIRGNCVYADAVWDPVNRQLKEEYRKGLET